MPFAVVGDELGPPESYRLQEHDPGPPAAGRIQVAIKVAGVSFLDVLVASGRHQSVPATPYIPGSECAGIVQAVGEGVTDFCVGDAVFATARGGLFAQIANVAAADAYRKPPGLSFEEAAVLPVSYATAHYGLARLAGLAPGETLLVLGAGGAMGQAAVQLGKHFGARVTASASSPAKRALAAAAGADEAVDSRVEGWRERVSAANDGKPFDVVFDPVGGPMTEMAFRSLGWNGRHLIVGFAAGIASLPTNLPLLKGARLIGVNLRQFALTQPALAAENMRRVIDIAESGRLKPGIGARYALKSFGDAMNDAAAGRSLGRVVLMVD